MRENIYKKYSSEQLEELFANYLIDSWSFSKVSAFSRNEKAFEAVYLYNIKEKRSASEVCGSAYHAALDFYFRNKMQGVEVDLATLQSVGYAYIDAIGADQWKLQKTTPTVADCIEKATDNFNAIIRYFMLEKSVYEGEIEEILAVEVYYDEFVVVNGVDIPLPCHARVDLIFRTKDGRIVVTDHKSKAKHSEEQDVKFSIGKQAITYVICHETRTGQKVDEVWFMEVKIPKNKDGSPQIAKFPVKMTDDTRRLYEAMLYEPLKRMVEAVSNPDYVYLINESDNLSDRAQLWEFWAQTMISEVSDFEIPESKQELIGKRLKKIRDASLASISPNVIKKFRNEAASFITYDLSKKDMTKEKKIEHVLRTLGIAVTVHHKFEGYSSDTFLIEVSAGVNISSIFKYKLDIACALSVPNVRIMKDLVIHDGRSFVALECAKKSDKKILWDKKYLEGFKIPVGIDNFGRMVFWDLKNNSTPHVLVCGATGSGKSVFLNSTIAYSLEAKIPEITILDPKREFTHMRGGRVDVFNDIEDIEAALELMVGEMNDRIKRGVVSMSLIVFDEFADAVDNSRKGVQLDEFTDVCVGKYKDGRLKYKREKTGRKASLEENLKMLLQKGRSCGIRVVAATQRASVKVITGDAKVNFPVQICFRVPKEIDSKVVLDEGGAEALCGHGDGLIKSPEYLSVVRFQGFFKE